MKIEAKMNNKNESWAVYQHELNLITMPNSETCERCKGKCYYEALVSQHDDKKETVKCEKCNGKGTIYQMTESEERDYWEDYW